MKGFFDHLLGIDPQQAGQGSFRFSEPWPGLLTFFVIIALVWFFYRLYQTEVSRASFRYRLLLTSLRSAAALLILFMLFRPVRVVEKVEEKDTYIVVLIDDSLSMSLVDKYDSPQRIEQLSNLVWFESTGEGRGVTGERGGEGAGKPVNGQRLSPEQLSRAELAARILAHPKLRFFQKLQSLARVRVYTFSTDVRPASLLAASQEGKDSPDAPAAHGHEGAGKTKSSDPGTTGPGWLVPQGLSTRLGDAIAKASDELRGQHIAGLVLITDGQSNSGRSPEDVVIEKAVHRDPPFPLMVVGVGSATPTRDVEILQVLANEAAFVNDEVIFSVLIGNKGFGGQPVRVQLKRAGEIVEEMTTPLLSDGVSQEIKIRHIPKKTGQFSYEVSIPPQEGETLTDNNRRDHLLRVVEDRIRVLYVSDMPSWEYRYLKNALIRDHSVEVSCWLQSADPDFIQEGNRPIRRFPTDREELYQFDVVVCSDVDFSRMNDAQIQALSGFVEDLGGGIFFGAGPVHGLKGLGGTLLEKLLPVTTASNGVRGGHGPFTEAFQLQLTPEGLRHPILRMEGDPDENFKRWNLLPGFFWYLPVRGAKPGALTLAVHPYERNDSGNHVMLAAQLYGAGRTIFLASDSTWRWRYLVGDLFFYRFWGQSIRFLSTGRLLGQDKRASLLTDRNTYHLGDDVIITARLLDEFYRPLEVPELTAEAKGEGSAEKVVLRGIPRRPGNYQGTFRPQAAGPYDFTLQMQGETTPVKRSVMVTVPLFEFDHPEMNELLLRKLAHLSQGHYFNLEEIDQVPGKIRQVRENITTEIEDDLWNSPLLLLLVAILLSAEWILRKKRMMI